MRVTVHKKLNFFEICSRKSNNNFDLANYVVLVLVGIVSMSVSTDVRAIKKLKSITITFVLFSDYSILACTSIREQKRKIVDSCMAIMKRLPFVPQHTHSSCQNSYYQRLPRENRPRNHRAQKLNVHYVLSTAQSIHGSRRC